MDDLKIVVVGCTKDSARYIKRHIQYLQKISQICCQLRMVLYENDSADNTLAILQSHPNVTTITEKGVLRKISKKFPNINPKYLRTSILAHGRNLLLDYVLKTHGNFDYMIVADLDNVISRFDPRILQRVWSELPPSWDVLTANNIPLYYDIWALRAPKDIWGRAHDLIWPRPINYDCWEAIHLQIYADFQSSSPSRKAQIRGKGGIEGWQRFSLAARNRAHRKFVQPYQVSIPINSECLEVHSAFGGMGIYRISKLHGCRYRGLSHQRSNYCHIIWHDIRPDICEHVPFHHDLRVKNNARIFIHPKLLTCTEKVHLTKTHAP